MGTLNRKIARRYGKAIELDNFKADGSLAGGLEIYDSAGLLPTSGVTNGTQAYVTANQKLYIRATGGWYNVATVNTTPTISSVADASSNTSPFDLAKDGSTTTVITITATDSEGFPLTFSAVANSGFNGLATVAQDSSVFTITPKSENSATTTEGTLTFRASDGVNIASEIATFTLTFKIQNSRFTRALIKASGNNGTNTTDPTDASSNNATITTPSNSPTNQAFSPHHPGGYSVEFNGSNSQLTAAHSSDFNIYGSTDGFTIEGWIYPRSYHTNNYGDGIICKNSGSTGWIVRLGTSSSPKLQFVHPGVAGTGPIGEKVSLYEWTHFAFTRATNGNFKLYQNGILTESFTLSGSNQDTSNALYIGYESSQSSSRFDGYIRDVRISDTIVYTADFTAPTSSLTSTSNTKFLACHLPYFADGSSSGHTVTPSNVSNERFGPYDNASYDPASNGASVYIESKQYYVSVPSWKGGTTSYSGEFTYEGWFYFTGTDGFANNVILSEHAGSSNRGFLWYSNTYYAALASGTSSWSGANGVSFGTIGKGWHHIALVRDGDVLRPFVNGKQGTTTTLSSGAALNFPDNATLIGSGYEGWESTDAFHLSEFRIVWGSAVYTSDFTPPTEPLSAITNTERLVKPAAQNIYNATGSTNAVVLGGDAKSSTAQTKNASASMYFDGTGDRVDFANLGVGTGDFLVEGWFRQTATQTTDYRCWFGASPYSGNTPFAVFTYNTLLRAYIQGNSWIEYSPFSINTWYHLALKRENGLWTFFVDGTSQGTSTLHATYDFDSTVDWAIMAHPTSNSYDNTGYVEDFRITTDLIRYPFIPAKETLTAVSGTSFLTAHAATITDGSSNSLSITSQGDPTVSNFAPASGMKSVLFDGNDYLEIADGTYKTFGSDNWTIEAWVYPTEVGTGFGNYIWGDTASSGSTNTSSTAALYNSSGKFGAYITVGSSTILTLTASNLTTPANKWYKIALVREGNTFTLFVDGTVGATATNSNAVLDSGQILTVGRTGAYNGLNFIGYISNYRIVKGTALYTNSFTPPTAELIA